MVTEFPLALLSEIAMGGDRDFDHYRSESAPPGYSNSTAARNGTQNESGLSEEMWSDVAQYQYYPNSNLSTMLPQPHQLKKDWSSVPRANNGPHGGSLSVGGVLNQVEDERKRSSFNIGEKLVGLPGRDMTKQNDLGEIFQDPFSYPNPSPASADGSGSSASNNYGGSILGSPLSKNGLPDPEVAMRVPSPVLPPIGSQLNSTNRRMTTNGLPTFSDASAGIDSNQVLSALSALNLQQGTRSYRNSVSRQADHSNSIRSYADLGIDRTVRLPASRNSTPLPEYSLSGMNMNGVPGLFSPTGNHTRTSSQMLAQVQEQFGYLKSIHSSDSSMELARKLQVSQPPAYFSDYGYLPGYPLDLAFSSLRVGDHLRSVDSRLMRYPSAVVKSSSYPNHIPTTLLDEFKSNKTRCYELSEIVGHVVEFSSDQYGSRFIQQKLETATTQEKDMVFAEIMPHAITLMTDVFGNYVVQKFFEHGSAAQIKELAKQLNGRVLGLSLQMYGCRVIQKAIEVVDLEQQTQMVAELEHHVMRCVRDQNGNHVIQKCIECVPQDVIHFIISTFYGQVVVLSTHSYGCRVIQRVLEHCDSPKTQQVMMDEILDNVLLLSQDQYGNYVVQHVLQHGKSNEKSAIIEKLLGQIVNMSRQKFASNVVERCLVFGSPVERQMLIAEMLGPTEENEALQEMMKDQFGNYVVQRVLETCTDQQREMILTRIKIHLTALKKYTYGKHIVARVEKLVTTGEKKLANQSGAYVSTA